MTDPTPGHTDPCAFAAALAPLGGTILEDSHEAVRVRLDCAGRKALETVKTLTMAAASGRRAIIELEHEDGFFSEAIEL